MFGGSEMGILKVILIIVYTVVCLGLMVLTFMQNKSGNGASGTVMGAGANNFYEKNKGKTKEGKLKRATILLGVIFVLLTITLGIVYLV